jgi:hypothetical protein
MLSRSAAVLGAVASAIALGGCGLGAGPGTSNVTLSVTRSFGAISVGQADEQKVPGSETVMRMLERHFNVSTRYGGGFVESIDGHSGTGSRLDWFYYVNGVEAPMGAAGTPVHHGDQIWWDLHDWSATDSIPAVVGSFPEPFQHGTGGRRLPVELECANDVPAACARVSHELGRLKVPFASQLLGAGSGTDSLVVIVGSWHDLAPEVVADLMDRGPAASGVYARFTDGGRSLALLDPHGHVARTLSGDAGLIAATAQGSAPPTWIVSGTDQAGVNAAAAALTPVALHDHFALAVQGSRRLAVPLRPGI